ncbi:general stress protein [Polymorphobacter multimanifer]|uniref:General stress protein 26 n=1 Tax=Polymorphobacter multimanifer TaxID=1070431 RepID=A0A841LAE7_9SPHN|nr:pyridoxamine 5'-phosphate oxidase family protein [Polymorphobacter multimanifer]MBB6227933.1 general stress protein 26 [Polymorphobacter multimanifer]GGI84942.1 general stress protein [Polymorphobacter multimanifer]
MTDVMTPEKIFEMIEGEHVCTFSSLEGSRIRSHPMSPQFVKGERVIWFMTETGASKLADLKADSDVTLAFSNGAKGSYVSLMGRANVVVDRAKVHELWSAPLKQYFDGPDDPKIVLIGFHADDADYWDGPNAVMAGIKMLVTAATGEPTDMGDSGRVAL